MILLPPLLMMMITMMTTPASRLNGLLELTKLYQAFLPKLKHYNSFMILSVVIFKT